MPVKSEKGLQLVRKDASTHPSPGDYSVQRPFGQKRPSRITTQPEEYKAWHAALDSSHSAQKAHLARQSVIAVGACIGSIFNSGN
jgi:hypothetical protein